MSVGFLPCTQYLLWFPCLALLLPAFQEILLSSDENHFRKFWISNFRMNKQFLSCPQCNFSIFTTFILMEHRSNPQRLGQEKALDPPQHCIPESYQSLCSLPQGTSGSIMLKKLMWPFSPLTIFSLKFVGLRPQTYFPRFLG